MQIRQFELPDRETVIAIWQRCGLLAAWNDPARDIARKMLIGRDLFLLGCIDGQVVATVMGGYDGHRGWINYLAVDPDFRGRGLGEKMVREIELKLVAAGCPKVNLQVRSDNQSVIAFYEKIGYAQEPRVSMGKRLISDQTDS